MERLYDEAHVEAASVLFEVCRPTPGSYRIHMGYRSDRFGSAWAESFAEAYLNLVRELFEKSELGELALMPEEELRLLDSFNETETPRDPADIVTRFRRCAAQWPEALAVCAEGRRYSYAHADRLTDALTGYLRARGIGKGKVVSILIPRDEFMPLASLGVLKSGAAYQPLDPSYPEERLRFMIGDAEASLLIVDRSLIGKLPNWQGQTLFTDEILKLPDAEPFDAALSPEDLFVLLYTSGTTGTPKGAMIRHGNVAELAAWAQDYYKMDESTRCAAYASFGFDAHMAELYPTLTCGGALYIIPDEIRLDLGAIAEFVNQNGITLGQMTTQVGRQFALAYEGGTLRDLMVGGEALVPLDPADIHFTLHNAYGPSECTVLATIQPVDRLYHRIPVGKALENVKLYVVNKQLRRLPLFAPGELLIAGPRVAGGYLHLPEKTAASFLQNPFTKEPGYERVYRTGDVVRLLPDGRVDFIGRRDSQVKVRGFRIELSEVEGVIRQFPGIRDATVQAFADEKTGMKYLAAYVVSDTPVDVPALNAFIKERKPPYMVPAVTMQLDAIPLTQNQKVNRKALPKPELKTRGSEQGSAAPLNILEQEIMDIAAEVLHVGGFGVTERFGDLGLSSISAIRLAMLLYKRFQVEVNARELVSEGCIQGVENAILAALLKKDAEQPEAPAEEKKPAARSCRLSFAQQGVYTEYQANPDTVQYNVPFELSFPEGTDAQELERAVRSVIDAHPYLLCRFVPNDENEIIQEPIPDFTLEIPVKELSAEEFESYKESFVRTFDLATGPAVRFEIVKTDRLFLLADMHHMVSDGASIDLFLTQLCRALDGEAPERESYSYYDFASEEEIAPETEAFFAAHMANAEEATRLIPDVFDETLPHTEKCVSVPSDIGAVKSFARRCGVTPAAVYLAACHLAFARYVCEDTVAIATVSNGRSNLKLGNTMGMFVNTLPLVASIDHKEKTADFLRRTAKDFSDTIAHENYPFARIASKYDFHPSVSYTYQIGVLNEYRTERGPVELGYLNLDIAKLPVSVYLEGTEEAARIQVAYDSALYSEAMMLGLAESIENAVRGLLLMRQ